jgi:hypothetical protein
VVFVGGGAFSPLPPVCGVGTCALARGLATKKRETAAKVRERLRRTFKRFVGVPAIALFNSYLS